MIQVSNLSFHLLIWNTFSLNLFLLMPSSDMRA